jgi:hypothetical protein
MKRSLLLFVLTALFCAGGLFAQCRSDEGYPSSSTDATTYKQDLNVDLSDYGVIFEEAAPWSGCTQAAADALYKKIYTTYNPSIVNKTPWPHSSDQVPSYGPYGQWLSGGDAALIQAAALRLANIGKLTKPLDDLVKRVNADYAMNVDVKCGFDGFVQDPFLGYTQRWRTQNSCMEDYSIGAMAWAWTAAYRAKRGIADSATPESAARAAASSALSPDTSVCIWNGQTWIDPAPSRGPCTGTVDNLRYNGYVPISMHGGDSMPYGMGLFTSLGGAAVGLKVLNPYAPLSLTSDEQFVVQALYNHARDHTYSDLSNFHESDCYGFSLSGTAVSASLGSNCGDGNTHYLPKMFPVADFVDQYAPPAASTAPTFGTFDPYLFCDTSVDMPGQPGGCFFYNSGRRAVYGTMGQSWVQVGGTPNFTNTGLSDYTVTFRTLNGNYLSARSGGGNDVDAEPTAPGSWEQFSLMIRTAGHTQLTDGDQVTLQSTEFNQAQWVAAEGGGGTGSVLNANRLYPHSWETFTIHKLNGTGAINSGDPVALTSIGGYYVSAMNGGGSTVTVDRTAALSWETFTIGLTHN